MNPRPCWYDIMHIWLPTDKGHGNLEIYRCSRCGWFRVFRLNGIENDLDREVEIYFNERYLGEAASVKAQP